jgi:hypothetical protein
MIKLIPMMLVFAGAACFAVSMHDPYFSPRVLAYMCGLLWGTAVGLAIAMDLRLGDRTNASTGSPVA